jgi:cytochrome c553
MNARAVTRRAEDERKLEEIRMRRLVLAAAALAAVAGNAHADTDVRTLANSCAICHGTDGKPPRDGLDRLAGMRASEFVDEMRELRDDPTEGRLMSVIARGYSDAEIRAMAAYFAKLR